MSRYAFLGDGRVVLIVTERAVDSLHLLGEGDLGLSWTRYSPTALAADGALVVFAAGSPAEPTSLVSLDVDSGRGEIVRRPLDIELDRAGIPVPRALDSPTRHGT